MFTIKHTETTHEGLYGGIEWVNYQQMDRTVWAGGKNVVPVGEGKSNEDYATKQFATGIVYVMNENGKTVAKYDLGGSGKIDA